MRKRILLMISVAGLALAGTKSYSIDLYQPTLLGGTQLAAGSYRVEVDGDKAMVRKGKTVCEAPVKVEQASSKYDSTSVVFSNGDGKMHLQEIHVGGTKTKLVFQE